MIKNKDTTREKCGDCHFANQIDDYLWCNLFGRGPMKKDDKCIKPDKLKDFLDDYSCGDF